MEAPEAFASNRRWVQMVTEAIEWKVCKRRADFLLERPTNSRLKVKGETLDGAKKIKRERKL